MEETPSPPSALGLPRGVSSAAVIAAAKADQVGVSSPLFTLDPPVSHCSVTVVAAETEIHLEI